MLSAKCIVEIQDLTDRAQRLSRGSVQDRAEASALLAKAKTLREVGESSDELRAKYAEQTVVDAKAAGKTPHEAYRRAFERYVYTGSELTLEPKERRDLLAGSQAITYSTGNLGGFFVPWEYSKTLWTALAQTDPLLSPSVCDFQITDTPTLQPQQISGYDLSTIAATQIAESSQQNAGTFPAVSGKSLRANITYRLSLSASFEAEQDVPGTLQKMALAYGVGFARKLGQDAINGNGITQPQGITTAVPPTLTSSYQFNVVTGSGFVQQDFSDLYFAVNRVYRASPLCSWLMSDSVYEAVRKTADPAGRPLLNYVDDREVLLGKPVHICPSLPAVGGSPSTSSTILFGDFSHFHCRASAATMQRAINTPGYAEAGQALYIGRIRMDSVYFDPSNGVTPPIVSMTVQA